MRATHGCPLATRRTGAVRRHPRRANAHFVPLHRRQGPHGRGGGAHPQGAGRFPGGYRGGLSIDQCLPHHGAGPVPRNAGAGGTARSAGAAGDGNRHRRTAGRALKVRWTPLKKNIRLLKNICGPSLKSARQSLRTSARVTLYEAAHHPTVKEKKLCLPHTMRPPRAILQKPCSCPETRCAQN